MVVPDVDILNTDVRVGTAVSETDSREDVVSHNVSDQNGGHEGEPPRTPRKVGCRRHVGYVLVDKNAEMLLNDEGEIKEFVKGSVPLRLISNV